MPRPAPIRFCRKTCSDRKITVSPFIFAPCVRRIRRRALEPCTSDETWKDAGASDDARNNAIGRALVWWLAEHPVRTEFRVRATLIYNGNVPTVELREQERMPTKS